MSRSIAMFALLALFASWARPASALDPRVGIYGDMAGLTQQVVATPFVPSQAYVLAYDYIPFRGYGLGVFADPGVIVTGVTPYWGGSDGCGLSVDSGNLHCGSATCIDEPNPVRLILVSFVVMQGDVSGLTLCAGPPSSSPLNPPAPYYTPCSPVNSYPADLAASPYGDGCAAVTTSVVATETLDWGSLKHRFE